MSARTIDDVIFMYTQHNNFAPQVSRTRCRASVSRGRMGIYQCARKPSREIGGYGLCEQHAREAEVKLGVRDAPKRPPTRFEREMAAMGRDREERDALLLACERVAAAEAAYALDEVNINDRPESWALLDELRAAAVAAGTAAARARGETP